MHVIQHRRCPCSPAWITKPLKRLLLNGSLCVWGIGQRGLDAVKRSQVRIFTTRTWKNSNRSCGSRGAVQVSTTDSDTQQLWNQSLKVPCHYMLFSLFTLSLHNGNWEARLFLRSTPVQSLQCLVFQHSGFLIINLNMLFIRAPDLIFHFLIQIVRLNARMWAVQERTCCYCMLGGNTIKQIKLKIWSFFTSTLIEVQSDLNIKRGNERGYTSISSGSWWKLQMFIFKGLFSEKHVGWIAYPWIVYPSRQHLGLQVSKSLVGQYLWKPAGPFLLREHCGYMSQICWSEPQIALLL